MKNSFLVFCLCLTACCQSAYHRTPESTPTTHTANGLHMGTCAPDEPMTHTHHGLNSAQ